MRTRLETLLRTAGLLLLAGATLSCSEEEEPFLRTQYAVLNVLPVDVAVEWNADSENRVVLAPQHAVVIGAEHRRGSTAPGISKSPLWCLRVRRVDFGELLFYGTDLPNEAYYEDDVNGDNRFFYFIIDEWLEQLERLESNCMSL